MPLREVAPYPVAERGDLRSGSADIREQDGGENAIHLFLFLSNRIEERFDGADEPIRILRFERMLAEDRGVRAPAIRSAT